MSDIYSAWSVDGLKCWRADPAKYPLAAYKANSFLMSTGATPSRAFVLMKRADVQTLSESAEHSLKIDIQGNVSGQAPLTVNKLYLVNAIKVRYSVESETNALYMVELADARLIAERWSDSQHTLRNYLEDNPSTAWDDYIEQVWGKCAGLGDYPGLPYSPDGSPKKWLLEGTNSWFALNEILRKLRCVINHNPVAGSFSIIEEDGDQDIPDGARRYVSGDIDHDSTTSPKTIRVYFPNPPLLTDSEDSYIDTATNAYGAIDGTYVVLRDELPREIDDSLAITNQTALDDRAAELAQKWLASHGINRARYVWSGRPSDVTTGAKIRQVLVRNFGNGTGTLTEAFLGNEQTLSSQEVKITQREFVIGKTDEEIGAISDDDEPGVGTVSLYSVDLTTDPPTLTDTGDDEEWYNIDGSGIPSGRWVLKKLEKHNGMPLALMLTGSRRMALGTTTSTSGTINLDTAIWGAFASGETQWTGVENPFGYTEDTDLVCLVVEGDDGTYYYLNIECPVAPAGAIEEVVVISTYIPSYEISAAYMGIRSQELTHLAYLDTIGVL